MKKLIWLVTLVFMVSGILGGAGVHNLAEANELPAAPDNLSATAVSSTQIDLAWDCSETGVCFVVERKVDDDYFQIVSGISGTSYSDTNLTPGTSYEYRVKTIRGTEGSSYSEIKAATPPIAAPSGLEAAVSGGQINLTWTDNSDMETGFKIERKTGAGSFKEISSVGANVTDYTDNDIQADTAYTYRVRAYYIKGDSTYHSDYSNEASAITVTAPAAPTNLRASAVSSSQINLYWTDNSKNETGFKIERKTGSGDYKEIQVVDANTTSFSDTGLINNTTYGYRVRAYNTAGGNSPYSNEVVITAGVPAAPTNLSAAAASGTEVRLSWNDNANNETRFIIERKTGSGSFTKVAEVDADITSYNNTGLTSNTTYEYRLKAANAVGDSAYSNTVKAVTGTIPTAPAGLTAEAVSGTEVKLSWTDKSNNETGFKIERKTGSSGSYTQIASVGANVTTYKSINLSANTTYYYRVRSYNSIGDSAYSNQVSVTTGVPAAPTNLTAAAASNSQINLTWIDRSNNETGFKIERKTGKGSYTEIASVGANVTSYSSKNLSSNVTYYYRVRAYNSAGGSAYSNEASATTGNIPAKPTNLKAETVSNSQINLTWTDNSNNEKGFKIERKTGSSGSYSQIASVGANVTSYSSTGLSRNTTYYYRIRAYNDAGNSAYSNEADATTGTVPAAPTNLTAEVKSGTQVELSWTDKSNNETGFKIERKTEGGSYSQVATVGANIRTYTNSGLSSNTNYYYRVRAYNDAGNSAYSNEVKVSVGVPAAPTNLKVTAVSSSQINLTWTDRSDNETGFRIERKTEKGSYTQIASVGAGITSYNNTGLSPGTTYYYRVRAYNSAGNSAYSNEVSAVTDKLIKIIRLYVGSSAYHVNNQKKVMDTTPIIRESRTLLPIRFVAEAVGADVSWEPRGKKVTITMDEKVIELWIDLNTARVNGVSKYIDPDNLKVKPIIISPGRTMLPLRFVAENLGCKVDWDAVSREIKVTYPAP